MRNRNFFMEIGCGLVTKEDLVKRLGEPIQTFTINVPKEELPSLIPPRLWHHLRQGKVAFLPEIELRHCAPDITINEGCQSALITEVVDYPDAYELSISIHQTNLILTGDKFVTYNGVLSDFSPAVIEILKKLPTNHTISLEAPVHEVDIVLAEHLKPIAPKLPYLVIEEKLIIKENDVVLIDGHLQNQRD